MPKRQADEISQNAEVQHSVWTIDYNPSNGCSDVDIKYCQPPHPDDITNAHTLSQVEYPGWDAVNNLTYALWSERPHPQSGTEAVSFLRTHLQRSENSTGVSVRDFDPSNDAGRSGESHGVIYVDVSTVAESAKRVATGRK